jgi:Na+-translocating ferredoxin:NAD+ oxidoreductase RnfG subunit
MTTEHGNVEASGRWGRVNMPAAVVMALFTAFSTTLATRCNGPEEAVRALEHTQRQQYDALDRRLQAIEADQRALLQRMQQESSAETTQEALRTMRVEALEKRLDRIER